jgi:hypothetical protein
MRPTGRDRVVGVQFPLDLDPPRPRAPALLVVQAQHDFAVLRHHVGQCDPAAVRREAARLPFQEKTVGPGDRKDLPPVAGRGRGQRPGGRPAAEAVAGGLSGAHHPADVVAPAVALQFRVGPQRQRPAGKATTPQSDRGVFERTLRVQPADERPADAPGQQHGPAQVGPPRTVFPENAGVGRGRSAQQVGEHPRVRRQTQRQRPRPPLR